MVNRKLSFIALGLVAAGGAACVESRDLPGLSFQTTVTYGERIYLVDATQGSPPSGNLCTKLGPMTSNSSAAISAGVDPDTPHNCFVVTQPSQPTVERKLRVDQVEVTNELYQLCIDSGACMGPDPSKSSPTQICQVGDEFDVCPVVEVPQTEAVSFCKWIGRRLPTSIEHIIMRQGNVANTQDPALIPPYIADDGNVVPATCDDAVLGVAGCMATKPRPVLDSQGAPVGGAARDVVNGEDGQKIFDLTGNLSEWTTDLFPPRRGDLNDLPWFCVAGLTRTSTAPLGPSNPPICPTGSTCVWGQYRLQEDQDMATWPVCITTESGKFSGSIGAVYGGSHVETDPKPENVGIYARKVESDPQGLAETSRARSYGFRCVGDRDSGMREGGNLELPAFDDQFILVNPTP